MKVFIRNYRTGDYFKIIELWKAAKLPFKPQGRDQKDRLEAEMRKGHGSFLFAMDNGQEIGVVLVTHDGRKGWINRLSVIPAYRKLGIGRKLVEAAEQWLDNQGIEIYACLIESYNKVSLKTFQSMGYIPFKGINYLTKRKFPEV